MDPNEAQYLVAYGPDANCTLAICPVTDSVYEYRPSLGANSFFIAFYGAIMIVQAAQLARYRTWWFGGAMTLGCVSEMVGYGGRIMLYENPFSFNGFLLQIICITFAPVFYTAAIYFTLSKIVVNLDPSLSRFPPKFFYYIFITSDVVALVLQGAGGGLSSTTSGQSKMGVDIALAGLSFQVFSLTVFISLVVDYLVRYCRVHKAGFGDLTGSGKFFAMFLGSAIILILARCAYRIAELHQGYMGSLIHDQTLFIVLEGVFVAIAATCLCIAHPGTVFGKAGDISGSKVLPPDGSRIEKLSDSGTESGEMIVNKANH